MKNHHCSPTREKKDRKGRAAMASIEKRTGNRGTSYRITVTVGRDASGALEAFQDLYPA